MAQIFGILNLSSDSFSDGGLVTDARSAIERAHQLVERGADVVDIGAVSSNPDGRSVSPEVEISRLAPVVEALDVPVSIDTFAARTQIWAAPRVAWLNDIRGFADPAAWDAIADARCGLVLMHALQDGRADRRHSDASRIVDDILRFFEVRLEGLTGAGVDRERIVLDPGMGFFLGANPQASVEVLRSISRIRDAFSLPVMVSVSRKSFLGALVDRPGVAERAVATVVAELFAVTRNVDWVRTHDPRALRDAMAVWSALTR